MRTPGFFQPAPRESVLAKLQSWPRLLVFDFDGTLAPLAATPDRARLPARLRRLLGILAQSRLTTVAMVSGRGLADLRRKVNLPGLIYIGNHGLTASRPELKLLSAKLKVWTRSADAARLALAPVAAKYPGSLVERKGPDVSLHYRRVAAGRTRRLLREAKRAVAGLPLDIRLGKKVLEFRPAGGGNKGTAVGRLAAHFAQGWKRRGVCLYLGDDRTDEDAFAVMRKLGPRAVGIKVGPGKTLAHYRLAGLREVEKLVRLVAEADAG